MGLWCKGEEEYVGQQGRAVVSPTRTRRAALPTCGSDADRSNTAGTSQIFFKVRIYCLVSKPFYIIPVHFIRI